MTRRKGEITRGNLKRKWPHHAALPAEKVRDPANREVIFCTVGVLSASPLTYSLRRDHSDFVVLCFGKPKDGRPSPSASVGNGCRRSAGGDPENERPTCVAQDEHKVQNVSSCWSTGPIDGQRCKLGFGLKV
jgi:hypothetical protein